MGKRHLAAAAACLALVAGWPAPASAHAALKTTVPEDGAVLAAPPSAVVLTFNEKLQTDFTTVRVVAGKDRVTLAEPTVAGAKLTQPLPSGLPAGAYAVSFRVVSADGHPISGKISFRASEPSPAPSAPSAPVAAPSATAAFGPPSSSPAAIPAADRSTGGGSGWLWLVGGLVLVAVLVGGVFVAGRRRSPSDT